MADTKAGKVDILIGTHRLLSSDIQFKQLGLLVIDEEQRFGVKHKEKIKKLKENVKLPIHLHTHDTSGNGVATVLMAAQAGGMNAQNLFAMGQQQAQPVQPQQPSTWTCTCGNVNTGNFCPNCGKARP